MFKQQYKPAISCFLLYCVLAITPVTVLSQEEMISTKTSLFQNASIGTRFFYGSFITPSAKLEYVRDSYSSFGEIYMQFQVKGDKYWQSSQKNPQWGISFLSGNTGARTYIGAMRTLNAFLNVPLIQSSRYSGSFRFGAGPGWVTKPYDVNTNPKNTIIGTKLNAFINLMFQSEIKISDRFFVNANVGFMHLSNGGTVLPNLGLNMPVLSAGVRYAFAPPVIDTNTKAPGFSKKINYKIYTTIGVKQWPWLGSDRHMINALHLETAKQVSYNNAVGGGSVFFYDRTLSQYSSEAEATPPHRNKLQIGLYGLYEHSFGKLSFPMQAGAYLYNRFKSPSLFQQIGMRYRFTGHVSAVILLKTHMGRADFIHTGIGYHF